MKVQHLVNLLVGKKLTVSLVVLVVVLLVGGLLIYQKIAKSSQDLGPLQIIDLNFDPEGPYAVLTPRRDGKALILNIKRTASYDKINYELVYNSEGVDRGASGEIQVAGKKGEYEQEILFGSCSTGGTCVYDPGVENGTLTLMVQKGRVAYRIITQWHLQAPKVAKGIINSGDSHFEYKIDPKDPSLDLVPFTMVNDLTGVPKLPGGKQVIGKVYGLSTPSIKDLPGGEVALEIAETPPSDSQIYKYVESDNNWEKLETKISDNKLTAVSKGGGIFAALTASKD